MPRLVGENWDRKFADALRIAMYGSGGNFQSEVEDLAKLLAEYDGVPADPERNRLLVALDTLKIVDNSDLLHDIDHMND